MNYFNGEKITETNPKPEKSESMSSSKGEIDCNTSEDKIVKDIKIANNCNSFNCLLKKKLNGISYENLVSLSLADCDLGALPSCLPNLKVIKELNLSHNNFYNVPECVLKCKTIEKLDFSYNNLESFDREPCFCQKLKYLNLEKNNICSIPLWILNVRSFNLKEFYFSYNKLQALMIHSEFYKVSHYELKKIELRNCFLFKQDLAFLKSIRTLQNMDISNNENFSNLNCFTNFEMFFHKPCWSNMLTVLKINNLQISILPEEITSIKLLEHLEISKNILSWLPNSLSRLENLKYLDVSHNELTAFPEDFSQLKNLHTLKAACNQIAIIYNSEKLESLVYIDFYENELETFNFEMSTIQYLDLEKNYIKTDVHFENCFESYEQKRSSLRSLLNENRANGPRLNSFVNEWNSEDESYSSESDDTSSSIFVNNNQNKEIENWDVSSLHSDNGCTESDNEWRGCDENTNLLPMLQVPKENIIFVDESLFVDVIQ